MSERERLIKAISARYAAGRTTTANLAEAILAAGFGDVAQAKAEALEDMASTNLTAYSAVALRERAAEYRA